MSMSIVTLYLMSRWISATNHDLLLEATQKNLPAESTYAGVALRESVCFAFTLAALNNLDIFVAGIQNAYLTTPCGENIVFTCGHKFRSEHKGKTAVVV